MNFNCPNCGPVVVPRLTPSSGPMVCPQCGETLYEATDSVTSVSNDKGKP